MLNSQQQQIQRRSQLRQGTLQVERQKDAAIKAAQARAAADYEAEVAQLNAMKLATEARINEKVKKSKQRARKKEEATTVEEVCLLDDDYIRVKSAGTETWGVEV